MPWKMLIESLNSYEYSFKFWRPWNLVKPSQSILLVAIVKTAVYTIQQCVNFYVLMDSTNVQKHTNKYTNETSMILEVKVPCGIYGAPVDRE